MPTTRRQFLRASTGLLAVMALPGLAACGAAAGPVSNVPTDTLRVAVSALQPSLDAHRWSSALGPRSLAPMFDALTFIQNDGQLRPALALAWSQPAPTTWQFKLRVDDAKFSNGEFFTPDSVKLSFERVLDPANKLPLRPLLAHIDSVEVVNQWTVNIMTMEPDAALPRKLSLVYLLPPRYFAQVGADRFAQEPVGTGFWQLRDFVAGKEVAFNQFRDTWRGARGSDPPPINALELAVTQDRAQALHDRQVDVATELTSDQAKALQSAGFPVQAYTLPHADDQWEVPVFGAPVAPPTDTLATGANIKGIVAEPNGSWWFDRATKTAMQRVAVAGGA